MKLTLILASQRCGSSLLSGDIFTIGGMGRPGEYLLPVVGPRRRGDLEMGKVEELIRQGLVEGGPDVTALKLMINHAVHLHQDITGGSSANSSVDACQWFLEWARRTYDSVNLVVMVRKNAVDQAISRKLANATGVFHVRGSTAPPDYSPILDRISADGFVEDLLRLIGGVLKERDALLEVARANGNDALLVHYEDLIGSADEVAGRLRAHARRAGMYPTDAVARRSLRKLVPPAISNRVKAELRSLLDREVLPQLE